MAGLPAGAAQTSIASGELSEDERQAFDVLRRAVFADEVCWKVIRLRTEEPEPAAYQRLREALGKVSPSQRATWRTLVADAATRRDAARLTTEVDRWQTHRSDRRGDQRELAAVLGRLLDSELAGLLSGVRLPDDLLERVDALAVVLDELVDELRREPSGGAR